MSDLMVVSLYQAWRINRKGEIELLSYYSYRFALKTDLRCMKPKE